MVIELPQTRVEHSLISLPASAMQVAHGFAPGTTAIAKLQADCLAGIYLRAIPNLTLNQLAV